MYHWELGIMELSVEPSCFVFVPFQVFLFVFVFVVIGIPF